MRIIGDTVFLYGVGAIAHFMVGPLFGWSYETASREAIIPGTTRAA
jgi:hypothetical protein